MIDNTSNRPLGRSWCHSFGHHFGCFRSPVAKCSRGNHFESRIAAPKNILNECVFFEKLCLNQLTFLTLTILFCGVVQSAVESLSEVAGRLPSSKSRFQGSRLRKVTVSVWGPVHQSTTRLKTEQYSTAGKLNQRLKEICKIQLIEAKDFESELLRSYVYATSIRNFAKNTHRKNLSSANWFWSLDLDRNDLDEIETLQCAKHLSESLFPYVPCLCTLFTEPRLDACWTLQLAPLAQLLWVLVWNRTLWRRVLWGSFYQNPRQDSFLHTPSSKYQPNVQNQQSGSTSKFSPETVDLYMFFFSIFSRKEQLL